MEERINNTCICCGDTFEVRYLDDAGHCFAEACDICAICWKLNCTGLSLLGERWCNKKNATSKPLEGQDDDTGHTG